MKLRLATFNLENLADNPNQTPALAERLQALRPHLTRLAADVLCLQEVNASEHPHGAKRSLGALDALIADTPYAAFQRICSRNDAGTDFRDVQNLVILSRFPVLAQRQLLHDLVPEPSCRTVTAIPAAEAPVPVHWDRPILQATLDIGAGRRLHVIDLHLRAPLPAFIPGQKQSAFVWKTVAGWAEGSYLAAIKRAGQALETRLAIEALFDAEPEALIAVCGDFNADAKSTALGIIRGDVADTGNGALAGRALVPLEASIPQEQRYTVRHFGERLMLDHLMVSRALLGRFRHAEIHNESLTDELVAFATGRRDPDSYHAPVVAEFDFD